MGGGGRVRSEAYAFMAVVIAMGVDEGRLLTSCDMCAWICMYLCMHVCMYVCML